MAADAFAVEGRRRGVLGLATFVEVTRSRPLAAVSAVVLALFVVVAVFAPTVAPYDPLSIEPSNQLQAPSAEHLLGTDELGRDVFSRIVFGARLSVYIGLASVAVSFVLGVLIGAWSAYRGGAADLIVQRAVDALMGFPLLILAMVITFVLGGGANNVIVAIAFGITPRIIWLVRSEVVTVRELDYVAAAVATGGRRISILFRHVIPNALTSVVVYATGLLGEVIIIESALSFLGLGVPPPEPSWGRMLSGGARTYANEAPWLVYAPGFAIVLVVLAFNLLGDALRDARDPRMKRR